MRYVVAIDVGIKNLGMCVFDFMTAKFVFWDNISLVHNGRYLPSNNVQYVREFVEKYKHFFEESLSVLVESQMRGNMRIIEAVLHTMFFEKCKIVNPKCIKAHYGIGTRNYRQNKQRAVEWVASFVSNNASTFAPGVSSAFDQQLKKDDLADSLLLVTYYLDTYSNQLEDELVFVIDESVEG